MNFISNSSNLIPSPVKISAIPCREASVKIFVNAGVFSVRDETNGANRFTVASDGTTTVAQNLDVGAGIDVTGNATVSSNLNVTSNATIGGNLTVTGNVGIAGTLTYEDVARVDAVGLSTFREGLIIPDNQKASFGTDDDGSIKHTGTNLQIFETTGNIQITNFANDKDVDVRSDDGSGGTTLYFKADGSTGEAILYNYGTEKLKTTSSGISVTGSAAVSGDLTVTGNVGIAGTLTYEDVSRVDAVGLSTFREGIFLPCLLYTSDAADE